MTTTMTTTMTTMTTMTTTMKTWLTLRRSPLRPQWRRPLLTLRFPSLCDQLGQTTPFGLFLYPGLSPSLPMLNPDLTCIFFLLFLQEREGKERGVTLRAAQYRKGLFHLMNETINPGLLSEYRLLFRQASPHYLKLSCLVSRSALLKKRVSLFFSKQCGLSSSRVSE